MDHSVEKSIVYLFILVNLERVRKLILYDAENILNVKLVHRFLEDQSHSRISRRQHTYLRTTSLS